jgi:hypothetical protein
MSNQRYWKTPRTEPLPSPSRPGGFIEIPPKGAVRFDRLPPSGCRWIFGTAAPARSPVELRACWG